MGTCAHRAGRALRAQRRPARPPPAQPRPARPPPARHPPSAPPRFEPLPRAVRHPPADPPPSEAFDPIAPRPRSVLTAPLAGRPRPWTEEQRTEEPAAPPRAIAGPPFVPHRRTPIAARGLPWAMYVAARPLGPRQTPRGPTARPPRPRHPHPRPTSGVGIRMQAGTSRPAHRALASRRAPAAHCTTCIGAYREATCPPIGAAKPARRRRPRARYHNATTDVCKTTCAASLRAARRPQEQARVPRTAAHRPRAPIAPRIAAPQTSLEQACLARGRRRIATRGHPQAAPPTETRAGLATARLRRLDSSLATEPLAATPPPLMPATGPSIAEPGDWPLATIGSAE